MSRAAFLGALALVFTVGLTFATVELPYLLDRALQEHVTTPGFDSQADEVSRLKTELFIAHYHLRTIGYACFATLVLLVAAGFAFRRSGLALLGGLAFMLPVFAQFASVMFFLAGLGLLNVVWLPVLDLSFDLASLGDVARAPYDGLVWLLQLVGLNGRWPLIYLFVATGLLLFFLGTFAWLSARARGREIADSWVYRLSRHPQYLGWILWSYGLLLLLLQGRYPRRSWGISPTLPWLLSTLVIIGVAMLEELGMRRRHGPEYEAYRRSAPFLIRVPRTVERGVGLPFRMFFGKDHADRPREVAVVLVFYAALFMAASFLLYGGGWDQIRTALRSENARQIHVAALVDRLRREPTGRGASRVASELAEMGEPSLNARLELLRNDDPRLRALAARAFADRPDDRALPLLTVALGDPSADVRYRAAQAIARRGPVERLSLLLPLIDDPAVHVRLAALEALAGSGARDVLDPSFELLRRPEAWVRAAAARILGTLGVDEAIPALVGCLRDEDPLVRRETVIALYRRGSPRVMPALSDALADEDWEVRLYAAEAVKRLGRVR